MDRCVRMKMGLVQLSARLLTRIQEDMYEWAEGEKEEYLKANQESIKDILEILCEAYGMSDKKMVLSREEILMDKIARLIGEYEDPTGWCCSNNVGCIITIDQDAWQYNGEKFELMGTWTSADGGFQ